MGVRVLLWVPKTTDITELRTAIKRQFIARVKGLNLAHYGQIVRKCSL